MKQNIVIFIGVALMFLIMSSGIVAANGEIINNPPVADANGPYEGCVGSAITLDASGSYDPDGDAIVGWHWDIDGDGQYDDASGETVMWTWGSAGTYVVEVKVSDAFGNADFASAYVTINDCGIPEFPTIALPVVAVLGLAFIMQRRKN
ncbi:PKD domain-containing protein [Methanolobus sediminis]|uniref:PKD domain-containing protein n=1 Tax=Methanolobus sediminis TaxID=3072978 RepID=A0AA51UI42_9EURY|nr:PKD domain-containing protein [Methanolobus sediminis]WMW23824.1 PKD domain-containing protein [Methanolobus sediminis]